MKHVCMIGEGAWGTAIATLLAANGHKVRLWCHDPQACADMAKTKQAGRGLPGVMLSELIHPTIDLEVAVSDADWIFEAIPVKFMRSAMERAKPFFNEIQPWVVLSKGIEQDTLLLPSQILDDVFGVEVKKAVVAGPSYAKDVATQQITAVSLASQDEALARQLQELLANDFFRPYISDDVIGVQAGTALKNVIALGVGMLRGAGYTDNTQAFLFTRGLHELKLLVRQLGGKEETVCGLAGVGDLVLTAMGSLSRNADVGKRLGEGQSLEQILEETGYTPEGINTVQSVHQMMEQSNMPMPICQGIYDVVFNALPLKDMLQRLMDMPLEWE